MQISEYIIHRLKSLKVSYVHNTKTPSELSNEIYTSLLSHKFRKYWANNSLREHCKKAIEICVSNNQPIAITFLQGAYKLRRLEESPEVDRAELFSTVYYSERLRHICEIYEPWVWFDFFVDDDIIPILNNVSTDDIETYIHSLQQLLNFLRDYQPDNMKMTITRVGDQFTSPQAFEKAITLQREKIIQNKPIFSQERLAMVELNAKPSEQQVQNPSRREDILITHDAYLIAKKATGYHFKDDKILAFPQKLSSGTVIALGTTKHSIVKSRIGIGALQKEWDSYNEYILSPKQIETHHLTKERITIEWLRGKNFTHINIF